MQGSKAVNCQCIRRLLKSEGIARQRGAKGKVFATESDLRAKLPEVWARVVK
jgi:hypothetical protein